MAGDETAEVFSDPSNLPAWYHRIRRQFPLGGEERYYGPCLESHHFDEDISELDEGEEEHFECHCEAQDDPDYGCECGPESDGESYNGPDADDYYYLKEMREDRKEEIRDSLKQKQKLVEAHEHRVDEVRAARKALKKELKKVEKGSPINFFTQSGWSSLGEFVGPGQMEDAGYCRTKQYELYSADFMEQCWEDDYYNYWKRVDFEEYGRPENDGKTPSAQGKAGKTVHCRIYASPSHEPALKPFRAPDHLSLKTHKIKAKSGEYKITIQFVGKDYLKMKVPRHVIKSNGFPHVSDSAPEVFEFVGILYNYEKRKMEMEEMGRGPTYDPPYKNLQLLFQ
ncbi:hypothetical protein F4821DRAFT_275615 [Hypoxylon rubiginosum]|uniref:Uncharacterized protein n=1 Tax=Hypoxylon rubiginosum TaxID=110542 RepID=A0ACC0CKC4_9PEZI|nr:hypothetical protein F4821DRAFT_275615 [Hypoxylon rubiginosum]